MEPRKISNEELADLPEDWLNPKVDTTKYYQCALDAWEIDLETFLEVKRKGVLCQKYNGKYYMGA